MADKPRDSDLLTPKEVAGLFRVDPKTVTRWSNLGRLKAIKTPGGQRRFRRGDIKPYLEEGIELMDGGDEAADDTRA